MTLSGFFTTLDPFWNHVLLFSIKCMADSIFFFQFFGSSAMRLPPSLVGHSVPPVPCPLTGSCDDLNFKLTRFFTIHGGLFVSFFSSHDSSTSCALATLRADPVPLMPVNTPLATLSSLPLYFVSSGIQRDTGVFNHTPLAFFLFSLPELTLHTSLLCCWSFRWDLLMLCLPTVSVASIVSSPVLSGLGRFFLSCSLLL